MTHGTPFPFNESNVHFLKGDMFDVAQITHTFKDTQVLKVKSERNKFLRQGL
jgi:hypothetical protein